MKRYIFEISLSAILTAALCTAAFFGIFQQTSTMRVISALIFSLILGISVKIRFEHFFCTFCFTALFMAVGFFLVRYLLISGGNNAFYLAKLNTEGSAFAKMYGIVINCQLQAFVGAALVYAAKCALFCRNKEQI